MNNKIYYYFQFIMNAYAYKRVVWLHAYILSADIQNN